MSLENLLNVETKDERWSALNCYSLSARIINADDIVGRLETSTGVLLPGDVSIVGGTGTVNYIQNAISYWIANNSSRSFHRIDAGIRFDTNVTAPVNAGVSLFQFRVTVPYGATILYPAVNDLVPGAASAIVVQTGAVRIPCSVSCSVFSTTQLQVNVAVYADISAPDINRLMEVGLALTYRINS